MYQHSTRMGLCRTIRDPFRGSWCPAGHANSAENSYLPMRWIASGLRGRRLSCMIGGFQPPGRGHDRQDWGAGLMKVLVTGCRGFSASSFIRDLLRQPEPYEVVNLDALTYAGNPANLDDVQGHPGYTF